MLGIKYILIQKEADSVNCDPIKWRAMCRSILKSNILKIILIYREKNYDETNESHFLKTGPTGIRYYNVSS